MRSRRKLFHGCFSIGVAGRGIRLKAGFQFFLRFLVPRVPFQMREKVLDHRRFLRRLGYAQGFVEHGHGIFAPLHLHKDAGGGHAITDIAGVQLYCGECHHVRLVEILAPHALEGGQSLKGRRKRPIEFNGGA